MMLLIWEAIEAASGRLGPDARAAFLQAFRDYRGPSQFEVYQEDAIPLAARVAIVLLALALAAAAVWGVWERITCYAGAS